MICPYCKESFRKQVEYQKKTGLFTILIKNHPNGDDCSPFIAFIDNNGRHRGSQKIDNVDDDSTLDGQFLESVRGSINELESILRFYHLKVPRRGGRGFNIRIGDVKDRTFMSSKFYTQLIEFLTENEDDNTFGVMTFEGDGINEDGTIIYGKYLGMIYTMFRKDQRDLHNKPIEEIKAYTNLTVEKLIELYDLMDFFF
jgi:hypothetical protein